MDKKQESRLKKAIADSVLSENRFKATNLNDVANLAMRLGDKSANGLTDWIEHTFADSDRGKIFKVVITTKSDTDDNATYVYESKGGFAANFYDEN